MLLSKLLDGASGCIEVGWELGYFWKFVLHHFSSHNSYRSVLNFIKYGVAAMDAVNGILLVFEEKI